MLSSMLFVVLEPDIHVWFPIFENGRSCEGVSSADLVQCLDDMRDLIQWRGQVKDQMDRCLAQNALRHPETF